MAKKYTLADIAKEIGVSNVTVSKALSGQKGVSEEVRSKIIRLADELGYKPPEHKIKQRERITIGVVVAERYLEESQSYYWKMYQELVLQASAKKGFSLLEVVDYRSELRLELPKLVTEGGAQGLIILGDFHKEYQEKLVRESTIPVVSLDTTIVEGGDAVVADNISAGAYMTDYLFSLGHRKIGYVGTLLATRSIRERYLGYVRSLVEHGLEYDPEYVVDDRDKETGYVVLDSYFHIPREKMPTAFFCNCDLTAERLITKLESMGYRVPEDVSVVGFDNYIVDERQNNEITTFEIDRKKMVDRVIDILIQKINNPAYQSGCVYVGGSFIEKTSAVRVDEPVPFV